MYRFFVGFNFILMANRHRRRARNSSQQIFCGWQFNRLYSINKFQKLYINFANHDIHLRNPKRFLKGLFGVNNELGDWDMDQ